MAKKIKDMSDAELQRNALEHAERERRSKSRMSKILLVLLALAIIMCIISFIRMSQSLAQFESPFY